MPNGLRGIFSASVTLAGEGVGKDLQSLTGFDFIVTQEIVAAPAVSGGTILIELQYYLTNLTAGKAILWNPVMKFKQHLKLSEMKSLIAFCGLDCSTCPIHLATHEPDKSRQQSMRESIAELCTKQYGINVRLEEVTDCDGCPADSGRLFSGCVNCKIRECAIRRNLKSCASCIDYACEKLLEFFVHDPEAQTRLEQIRSETGR